MAWATLLIVDDDTALTDALSEMLQLRLDGVDVETSNSAHDALEKIDATEYSAIVADIKMPGMDGLELLTRIRELRPDTPTILITGHGEHELAVRALRGGAYDYVQKPIDRDYFLGSLKHALEVHRLTRQASHHTRTLEREARALKDCLEDRNRELRILYQREATARDELDRVNQDLMDAQRRRQELIAMVAHDLGTPLTTLRGYVELLAGRGATDEAMHQRARSIILSETSRLERLVKELVESDPANGTFTVQPIECDIAAIVKEQAELARARSRQHTIQVDVPESLPVRCDADRMAQVFGNLLTNALTHTERGTVAVRVWHEDGELRASVQDQGRGIPANRLEKIFSPRVRLTGHRSTRRPSGAGLGLGIARAIVEAHNGRLWAENKRGKGARFVLALPCT